MDEIRYAVCAFSHIPVRKTVSDASEMVTELLFGDLCVVIDRYKNWLKIENHLDGYTGWIDSKQVLALEEEAFLAHASDTTRFFTTGFQGEVERLSDQAVFRIGMGCRLPFYNPGNREFRLGGVQYRCRTEAEDTRVLARSGATGLLERAGSLLNTPYLWGGKSCFALDCSGFTQLLYRMYGFELPRDASQQAALGTDVPMLEEARAGDLLFFDNPDGNIVHVGIYMGNGRIIHSSGFVRMDSVDHEGIWASGRYSHHLRLLKDVGLH